MNRISQRAYRARKDAQVAQYQDKIAQLEGEVEELARQRVSLMALNEYLIRQNRQLTMRRDSP
jgi:TolA-binding protein